MKKKVGMFVALLLLAWIMVPGSAGATSIHDNPHVSFSPDGQAWTTDAGETGYEELERGYTVSTGEKGSHRGLEEGEHYYSVKKEGFLSIEMWRVGWAPGHCIHGTYREGDIYHDLTYVQKSCFKEYKNGWIGTCADCQDEIKILFYMDSDTAASLKRIPLGLDYYYLCPHCTSLEQGASVTHDCRDISWNKYYVVYMDATGKAAGYMPNSVE